MRVPTLLVRIPLVMWEPSTQAGFAEYRLVVKKANQVEDTARKNLREIAKVLRWRAKLSMSKCYCSLLA